MLVLAARDKTKHTLLTTAARIPLKSAAPPTRRRRRRWILWWAAVQQEWLIWESPVDATKFTYPPFAAVKQQQNASSRIVGNAYTNQPCPAAARSSAGPAFDLISVTRGQISPIICKMVVMGHSLRKTIRPITPLWGLQWLPQLLYFSSRANCKMQVMAVPVETVMLLLVSHTTSLMYAHIM